MKNILLFLMLSTGPLLAQSGSFWNSYPSQSQSRQGGSNQPSNGCEWREREITITILGNDELWLNADILTHTCNSEGKPVSYGDYVRIENRGKSPFYYRSFLSGTYENLNSKFFQTGTSSNAYYFELAPNEARIVNIVEYRSQKDKFLPTHAVLNVKYCKPTNYPTQAGSASLQLFKANQQQYNVSNSSEGAGNNNAIRTNNTTSTNCKYYFLAVVMANYSSSNGDYIYSISSDIYQSSSDKFDSFKKVEYLFKNLSVFDLPQRSSQAYWPSFSDQDLVSNIRIDVTYQGHDLYYGNTGGGLYSGSGLHIYWSESQNELEEMRKNFSTAESYKNNLRQSYNGSHYEGVTDNSIFTFNQNFICPDK